jgi:hypothetical protein
MFAKKVMSVLIFLSMVLAAMFVFTPSAQAHTESEPFVTDLIAGGGNPASEMNVGNISVWNDADYIYVQFNTYGDCYLTETHLAVGTMLDDIPQTKKGNPIPGQFEYFNESHDAFETSYTYMIPLDLDPDEEIFIAAHAVVCCTDWEPGPELVVNGDFESPVVDTPQLWENYSSGTDGLGWAVEWYDGAISYAGEDRPDPANLELHRGVNGWLPNTGSQYAELDTDWDGPSGTMTGEPASVNISQDLPTGHYCQLDFSWSPRPGHSDNQLEVYWEDGLLYGLAGPGVGNTDWTDESVILFSSEDSSTLAFVEKGTPDSLGMFLDSVSVNCFPCETAWGAGEDFPGANWATYFTYIIQEPEPTLFEGAVTFAWEDLPLDDGLDWDFNDFVTKAYVEAAYSDGLMTSITLTFEAMAKGAAYDHNFYIFIPAGTFGSDGTMSKMVYEDIYTPLWASPVNSIFDADIGNQLDVFSDTSWAMNEATDSGAMVNVFDGSGLQLGKVVEFTIVFDTPIEFDLSGYTYSAATLHGDNLFFKPRLRVLDTGEWIHPGDIRTLLVPTDWQWPQETTPIWNVYPYNAVTMEGVTAGDPPSFTTNWYTETPTDLKWTP